MMWSRRIAAVNPLRAVPARLMRRQPHLLHSSHARSSAAREVVEAELPGVINWMDAIEFTIWSCQQAGQVARAADGHLPEMEPSQ